MFIEQGVNPENKFWKYILGSLLIIFTSFIGQIPLILGILYKTYTSKKLYPKNNDEVMRFLEPNCTLFLLLFSFVFVFLGIYFVVRNLHHQTLLSIITSRTRIIISCRSTESIPSSLI